MKNFKIVLLFFAGNTGNAGNLPEIYGKICYQNKKTAGNTGNKVCFVTAVTAKKTALVTKKNNNSSMFTAVTRVTAKKQ